MIKYLKQHIRRGLKHSDKILKIDTSYILKGGFWLTVGQFAATGTGFLVATAFANYVPQEVYGNYKYALALISIVTVFTLPGINSALATAIASGREGSYLTSISKKIRWGLFGSVASLGISAYFYFLTGNREIAITFVVVSFFLPFMDSFSLYSVFLQSKKLFRESTLYFVTSQLLATFCLISAIIFSKNLNIIILTYFFSWTSIRFFYFLRTLRKFPPNTKIDPLTETYGIHITAASVLSSLTTYLDSLLLFHSLGPAQVAVYNIAIAPPEQVRALSKNIPSLALPKLAQRSLNEINSVLKKRLQILFLIGLLSASIYYLISPFFFDIFFNKYHESLFYSRIFAFTLAIRLPLTFLSAAIQSKLTLQRKRWLYYGMIPQIILIVSLIILIYLYGIFGIIISRFFYLILAYITAAWQWHLLIRHHEEF